MCNVLGERFSNSSNIIAIYNREMPPTFLSIKLLLYLAFLAQQHSMPGSLLNHSRVLTMHNTSTEGQLFMVSKVQCLFGFETCTPEGEGEKREGVQISKNSTQYLWPHKFLAPCI